MIVNAYSTAVTEFLALHAEPLRVSDDYIQFALDTEAQPAVACRLVTDYAGHFEFARVSTPHYHLNDGTPPPDYRPRIKTSITLDPLLADRLDHYCLCNHLSLSQAIEAFLAAAM